MNDAGVPVWRSTIHIRQLHPELFGRTYLWTEDMKTAQQIPRRFGVQDTAFFRDSPIALIYDGGPAMRRRLAGAQAQIDFPILAELQADGASDYTAHPVRFGTGDQMAITFATRRPDGFADRDLALIDAILPALSPLLELRQVYLNAEALLDTYVGHDAGARILSGDIHRGDPVDVRHPRLHANERGITQGHPNRAAQRFLRLHGRAGPCAWRRSAEIHG